MRHVSYMMQVLQVSPVHRMLLVTPDGGILAPTNRHDRLDGRGSYQATRRRQYQGLLEHGMAKQPTPLYSVRWQSFLE